MGVESVEEWRGEDYVVRRITGSASTRPYRCPGCDQQIRPATPHVVAWPAADPQVADPQAAGSTPARLADRRHWHAACWRARDRRAARPSRGRRPTRG
ncbi:MAG: hypothetical protein ACJ73E_08285 [Mycobacteriales bacterium]